MAIRRKIILSGELAKKFGKQHLYAVSTPAEAIRALSANYPDFKKFLYESESRGVGYKVIVDKAQIEEVEAIHNPMSKTLRIVPVITGSKGGFLGVILGAALIASSFYLPTAPLIAGFSTSLSSIAFGIGTSLLLGGISQMLSPQPKAPKPSEAVQNQPSYTFNGAVNTTAQGQCVPVGYGRLIVGSAVISAGITADDYSAAGLA